MEASKYPTEMKIENVRYVREDLAAKPVVSVDGLPYVCVRTQSAGVFLGYLESRNGKEVSLINARRVWCWSGAASLSELAQRGTSNPKGCKWPAAVTSILLLEAIEIIPCTEQAKKTHEAVAIWTA